MGGNKKTSDVNTAVYTGQGNPPLSERVLLLLLKNRNFNFHVFKFKDARLKKYGKFLNPCSHEIYPKTLKKIWEPV